MALISTHVEQDELGNGVFRNTIAMKAIAYRQNGVLLRMNQAWEDGDVNFPQMVTRAPLMVSTAGNGTRRIHPTREADRYIEMGAPFAKVGGTWTRVTLGAPTRANGRLTWTRPNYNLYIDHGGHFIKLAILLKNGFVPEDGLFAFPVGISGLTRVGNEIRRDGVPVMQLRPLHVEDLDNPLDIRPITHDFVSLAGQPYLLCTLPDLTGMSRPLIDPTLSLQPDATDGIDATVRSAEPDANYGTYVYIPIGEQDDAMNLWRSFIKFDLSTLPTAATVSSATFSLYADLDRSSNARTFRVFRLKRAWSESQVTWNIFSTGNNWSTAGGFHSDDCEQTDIGSRAMTATETLNVFKDFSLTPTSKSALDLGNGWLLKADVENSDCYFFSSSDSSTAANRPKLEIIYTVPSGSSVPVFMANYRQRRRMT